MDRNGFQKKKKKKTDIDKDTWHMANGLCDHPSNERCHVDVLLIRFFDKIRQAVFSHDINEIAHHECQDQVVA